MTPLRKFLWSSFITIVLFELCLEIQGSNRAKYKDTKTKLYHHQKTFSPVNVTGRSNRVLGRHVCIHNNVITKPVKHVESYCKPVYKTHRHLCDKKKHRYCTSYKVVYERAYRSLYKMVTKTEEVYACCPGWSQLSPASHGCLKALCSVICQNSGKCIKPDRCSCTKGWTGRSCDVDVNECRKDEYLCEHQCINIQGSYRCECHRGFRLQSDGKSCKISLEYIPGYQEFLKGYEELTEKVISLEKVQRKYNFTRLENRLERIANKAVSLQQQQSRLFFKNSLPTLHYSLNNSLYGSAWDRINSLSEQISILEERLGHCTCNQ
ncbi:epidermal growth factor-like protein 8 [Tachypleus tridentatus]|uniref:epidermal growth factor-like protein 8 n=1 Tax=Tachypleus tridentatus TaxID=6853 RepID=UPI003FD5673B